MRAEGPLRQSRSDVQALGRGVPGLRGFEHRAHGHVGLGEEPGTDSGAATATDSGSLPATDTGTSTTDTGTPITDDTGTAEDASAAADASTGPAPLPEASTCGCELPGRTRTTAPFTALGLALGLVAVRRRRR